MPALRIYTGNRLETLADELGRILLSPLGNPLAEEIVMVQSRGMERWLRMRLAGSHGVCVNVRFPFPSHFFQTIFSGFFPDCRETGLFSPEVMAWRIMELLSSLEKEPEFQSVYNYLASGRGDLRRFQLSELIADTFDQYLVFRPELIFRWEKGEENHWQARLWRMISSGHETGHRAALARDFIERIEKYGAPPGLLPQRLSVFGISALPRFHMNLLAALGNAIPVNIFLMNPCAEYWGDISSERTILSRARKAAESGAFEADLYSEGGNPLLASMGTLGRDFFDMATEFPHHQMERFNAPGMDSLLRCIQSDILSMYNRTGSGDRINISPEDFSVQIHSCHSRMREIEIIHDVLLDLLQKLPGLTCEDILVMAPDMESYGPFIRSVFDRERADPVSIPFSITDRTLLNESPVAGAFLRIMDLCSSRCTASDVIEILEADPVGSRFRIPADNLTTIKRWIRETRICWGVDGSDKALEGLPVFEENTWRAGVSRLLLGYALPELDGRTFQGIPPYGDMEGGDAELLGKLCAFLDVLFQLMRSLREPRPVTSWVENLEALLADFFEPSEPFLKDMQCVRNSLAELDSAARSAGFTGMIDLATVKRLIRRKLEKMGHGAGFITRGVTFCEMLPMRSIPFRVVCLLGLNSDTYPRRSRQTGFDLIAGHPRKGDRSRRADDRYLFLEALLSARDVFCVSHVGASVRDNSTIPPSVVTSELLDYISTGFSAEGGIENHVVTRHPLQPFSPDYFRPGGRLYSYSIESLEAARAAQGPRKPPAPFVSGELEAFDSDQAPIRMEDLCSFFAHPARHFLKNRLGVHLDDPAPAIEEREPFAVEGLDRYQLENRLLSWLLSGRHRKDLFEAVRFEGLLPHGNVGKRLFNDTAARVEDFARRLLPLLEKSRSTPLEAGFSINQFEIKGLLDRLSSDGRLYYRYAPLSPKTLIQEWIKHLMLCSLSPGGVSKVTLIAGLSGNSGSRKTMAVKSFVEISDPVSTLARLINFYREGLHKPLPFSPYVSWEYVKALGKGLPGKRALDKAREKWEGSDWARGESQDPYNDLCFKETGLVGEPGFAVVAAEILEPMISHTEDLE